MCSLRLNYQSVHDWWQIQFLKHITSCMINIYCVYFLYLAGEATVMDSFNVSFKKKPMRIAGCRVTSGVLQRKHKFRIIREEEEIYNGNWIFIFKKRNETNIIKKGKLYIDIGRCGMSANETTLHPNNNL